MMCMYLMYFIQMLTMSVDVVTKFKKIQKCFIFTVSLVLLLWQVSVNSEMYFVMETILDVSTICWKVSNLADKISSGAKGTRQRYENIAQMPFPVFTVCPAYPYKSERLVHHGVSGAREIQVILCH